MNAKQRYIETMLFGNPDRVPLSLGMPRESTLAAWRDQGLPPGHDFMAALFGELGIGMDAALKREWLDVKLSLMPEFETKILDHRDGHCIVLDWMGAVTEISDRFDESYLRKAKDFVTRKWHKFPVENREDWQEMKKRYDPDSPGRMPTGFTERCRELERAEAISSLCVSGVFWQLREWCGFENLCLLMADDPAFVHDMAGFWIEFVSVMLEIVLSVTTPVCLFIQEDMAYKGNSMISPAMTREFIQPAYKRWAGMARKKGCPIVEVDSDGYIGGLIPIWIESGINCCSPVEVAAHCSATEFRREFGRNMAYSGGIDKRVIARGGAELTEHVLGIVPDMFRDGGYIPGCDHGVPPDISWPNYLEFGRLIAKLSGWL